MPKEAGAETTYEMGGNGHTCQVALSDAVHHAHMGTEEPGIADADGRKDAYSFCVDDPDLSKRIWQRRLVSSSNRLI